MTSTALAEVCTLLSAILVDNEDGTELASTQREHSLPVLSSKQVRSNLRLTITNKFQSLRATMSEAVVTLNSGKRTSFFMCITTGQSIFFVGWTWYLSFRTELLSACAHTHTHTHTHTCTHKQTQSSNNQQSTNSGCILQ